MQEQCTAGCSRKRQHRRIDLSLAERRPLHQRSQQEPHLQLARKPGEGDRGAVVQGRGYQGNLLGDIRSHNRAPNNLQYRVNNGVPNQLTMFINNYPNDLDAHRQPLRTGAMDAQSADAAGSGTRTTRRGAGAPSSRSDLPSSSRSSDVPEDAARRFLPRHRSSRLGGLRPVRQRQDGGQGNVRALPRGSGGRGGMPSRIRRAGFRRACARGRMWTATGSPTAIC